jgi:archaellin
VPFTSTISCAGVLCAAVLASVALSACATTQEESAAIGRADKVAAAKLEAKERAARRHRHARKEAKK